MSESTTVQDVQEGNVITFQPTSNPFAEETWVETPIKPEVKVNEPAAAAAAVASPSLADPSNGEKGDEFVDADEWLKTNYGWENADAGKKELEELRKLRETAQTPAELKFANEQSEKFFAALKEGKEDEVYNYLNQKRSLERLEKLELKGVQEASEIIKANLQFKHPDLTNQEIDFLYNKRYSLPPKPKQSEDQDDAEFAIELEGWQNAVKEKEQEMIIEAKLARPDLVKYKSELVLPDIPKAQPEVQQPAEDPELEAKITAWKGHVFQKLDSDAKNFNGYNATYKDEAVEIPVAFTMTEEERIATLKLIKESVLGEDYNFNNYFNQQWFDEKGNPKVEQMMADVYLLNNREKVFQKFINEAVAKRLEHKMKTDSNIVIHPKGPEGTFNPDNRTEPQKLQEFFWNQ